LTESPLTWPVLARRAWLLVAGALAGLAVAWFLTGIAVSATSAFAVRAIGADQTPYQSTRLALTYARLLPDDPALVGSISRATGTSRAYVRSHLTMSAEPETNVVFARFSAAESGLATAAIEALATALRNDRDAAGSDLGATAVPLSAPTLDNGFSRKKGLLLGALGGLLVALAAVIGWERRRPKVDDLRLLSELVPLPISLVSRGALPRAVGELHRAEQRDSLALVPVPARPGEERELIDAAGGDSPRAVRPGGPCALLIGRGAPAAEIEAAWRNSSGSGAEVVGALLVARPSRWRLTQRNRDGLPAA
jgi:hypothetical protein